MFGSNFVVIVVLSPVTVICFTNSLRYVFYNSCAVCGVQKPRLPAFSKFTEPGSTATYGAEKLWVVLKPIPIEVDSSSASSPSPSDDEGDEGGDGGQGSAGQSGGARAAKRARAS